MFFLNKSLHIYIVRSYPSPSEEDCIYLLPNSWNDFGYKTSFLVYLCVSQKIIPLDMAKIATDDDTDIIGFVIEKNCLPANSFSLGQTENYYETLMSLGDEIRESFFVCMRDLVFDKEIGEKAVTTRVFNKSLIRFLNIKTINNIFYPLSHGVQPNKNICFSYTFPTNFCCEGDMVFELDYENDITNAFAIIGSNGCGKTTFIKDLIKNIYLNDFRKRRITFLTERKNQNFNLVINISFTGFDDYVAFDEDIDKALNVEPGFPSYHSFTINNVKDKLNVNFLNLLGSVEKIEKFKKYFSLFVESIFFDSDLLEEINNLDILNDVKAKSALVFKILEKYDRLSSGQKFIFATTLQITNAIVSDSLILIDEPENHMHPPLLSLFVNMLSMIAKDNNSMVIMATHSPIVLQEITSDKIFNIKRNGDYVSFFSPECETYGSSYATILNNVFGDEVYKTGFYKVLLNYVNSGLSYEEILSKLHNRLGDYGRGLLAILLNNKDENN